MKNNRKQLGSSTVYCKRCRVGMGSSKPRYEFNHMRLCRDCYMRCLDESLAESAAARAELLGKAIKSSKPKV